MEDGRTHGADSAVDDEAPPPINAETLQAEAISMIEWIIAERDRVAAEFEKRCTVWGERLQGAPISEEMKKTLLADFSKRLDQVETE